MAFVIQSVVSPGDLAADALLTPDFPADEDHSDDQRAIDAAAQAATILSAVFDTPVQVVASGDANRLSVTVAVLPEE